MADLELFKLLLQGGSFAVVVLFVVWVLFKASPRILSTTETLNAQNAETVKSMTADHKTTMLAMAAAFQTTIATLTKEFRESLAEMHRECREERAEMQARFDEIAAKDRDLRHDMADKFTAAINHLATSQMRPAAARGEMYHPLKET